jgi:hypothetical protein
MKPIVKAGSAWITVTGDGFHFPTNISWRW